MVPFKNYVNSLDELHLVALESAVSITKSVALGDSVISGSLDISTAFILSGLEDLFKNQEKQEYNSIESFDNQGARLMISLEGALNLLIFKSLL